MAKYFIALLLLISLKTAAQKSGEREAQKNAVQYTYTIIPAESGTYGYDIYANKKLLIHQPSIPGMPGNKGFLTKSKAITTAKFAIKKLQQGIVPPTITKEELQKLKVIP